MIDMKARKLTEEQIVQKQYMLDEAKLNKDEYEIIIETLMNKAEKMIEERVSNLKIRNAQSKLRTVERNIKVLEKQIRTREEKEIIIPV